MGLAKVEVGLDPYFYDLVDDDHGQDYDQSKITSR